MTTWTSFHEDEIRNTLGVKPAGNPPCRNCPITGKTMQKLTRTHEIVLTFDTFFSMLYTISTTIDYVQFEKERVAVNKQGTVFALIRMKIVHSYHQNHVSHPRAY